MSPQSSSASVTEVLQQFMQGSKDCGWFIEDLAEGVHANIYSVRSQNNKPIWQTHHALAVKLYKPAASPDARFVREQFEALSRFYSAVDGCIIDGWKVFAPAPLYLCRSPPAVVMSMVPGRRLCHYFDAGDDASSAIMDSVPSAIIAAMERCWSVGQTHGDLNFDNILCDLADRALSFVDMGVPTNSLLGGDSTGCCHPAAQDLGYMLYETGAKVRSTFGKPSSRLRKERFAECVLRAFMETIAPREDKQRLLDEIHACARVHLKSLDLSLSPHGLWHALVRSAASRCIDRLLAGLRTDARVVSGGHAPNFS
jgi:hypothetical protein